MKARLLTSRDELRAGMVLARGIGPLQKGAVLTGDDLARLPPFRELSVVEMEPGDVHEDAAGARLAKAACGEGVAVQPLQAGSWPLAARHRGLVEVDAARLAQLNDSDDLAVVTKPHGQLVLENDLVGRAKIIPFVTREEEVARAERIGAVLRVRPFLRMRVAALVQEALDDDSLAKFRAAFEAKVRFFGSEVAFVERGLDLRDAVRRGAQVIAMAGSKLMDPLDPAMQALATAGARIVKHGIPLHPGTLLWLAEVEGVPVVGAPACALFQKLTAFDLLLPLLLTGEKITRARLAALGQGGLLDDSRFPPYRR